MNAASSGIMAQADGEAVDSQPAQSRQQGEASQQGATTVSSSQHEPSRYSPEQLDDLAERLLSGDRAAVGEVETHQWDESEFEAFLFSLEVGIPKIAEGGPFKAGFGRQIVDSALSEYLAEDNDEPFGSILMDYVDGLSDSMGERLEDK